MDFLSTSQRSFMEDFIHATRGYISDEQHVWEELVEVTLTNAPKETDIASDEMFIDWFGALYPGNGHGGEALDHIIKCADDNGVRLLLKPQSRPQSPDEDVLDDESLRDFYRRRGFILEGGLMVREPLTESHTAMNSQVLSSAGTLVLV